MNMVEVGTEMVKQLQKLHVGETMLVKHQAAGEYTILMLEQKFRPSSLMRVFNTLHVAELINRAQAEHFVATALPFDRELEDLDARATGGRGVPAVGGAGGADYITVGGDVAVGEGS